MTTRLPIAKSAADAPHRVATIRSSGLTLRVTPTGQLHLDESETDDDALPPERHHRITLVFQPGVAAGLLGLALDHADTPLPPSLAWGRDVAAACLQGLVARAGDEGRLPPPDSGPVERLEALAARVPPCRGAEYVDSDVIAAVWTEVDAAVRSAVGDHGDFGAWLAARHAARHLVGRVHLHLAERRGDPETPFAFLATYSVRLDCSANAQHRPLGKALREYSDAGDRDGLLALLLPVQRAAERCVWLRALVDSGELFQPIRWTADEALALLRDVPVLEASGVVVKMPAAWGGRRPSRPRVAAKVGSTEPSLLGFDALLDFEVGLSIDGEPLTPEERQSLLDGSDGLRLLRGQWVEVQRDRLQAALTRFEAARAAALNGGISFLDAMKLLSDAGASEGDADLDAPSDEARWSDVYAGPWLKATLAALRDPQGRRVPPDPGDGLKATLRPYQQVGLAWLHLLWRLKLGGCLADDMGLGKTIQVLALLLVMRREGVQRPSLLVVPASLIGNWVQEAARFAPSLRLRVLHGSAAPTSTAKISSDAFSGGDLVITSYGTVHRTTGLDDIPWEAVILDEAQTVKNAATRQSKAVKALQASWRLALTGTPVENRLADLWSLFEFTSPGLLGSAKAFGTWTKALAGSPKGFGPLRNLVRPYVLRRMKTDKSIISDLPDKTEVNAWCGLSPVQAALYEDATRELAEKLVTLDGIARRGLILSFLMRFKQICNHPSHWTGDGVWRPDDSGKLLRLGELAETIAEKQEKVLVFTQFRETIEPLAAYLGGVFGRPGLILHGGTPVKQRQQLVARFEQDEDLPFFVLSLKAGGTGLTLTSASHVVHFDRWWNPAVETQATDRAYRIGQKRNVLVHKLVCRGTLEEKIDALIESKQGLARSLVSGDTELDLASMSTDDLMKLVRLDFNSARGEL